MKIGIKLLLAGVFTLFTVLTFAQGTDKGGRESKHFHSQDKPIPYKGRGDFKLRTQGMKKAPIKIAPTHSTCPAKKMSK